jgi:hypothetical protein
MQGSDVFDTSTQSNDYTDMPTFSKEDGGCIKAFNNYMTGQSRFVPYGATGYPNPTVDYDAYVATSREEQVGSGVISARGSNAYNNFDTNPTLIYTYTPDSPEVARDKVMAHAGRINGGDFKWTFDNAVDDASSDVNTALKAALVAYQTSLVAVQGDSTIEDDPNDPPVVDSTGVAVHNFTLSGKASTFFSITGNLSTSKGTVSYAGLTLSQCLKMESSTVIAFTTLQESTLTLVFNDGFTGRVKLDNVSHSVTNGILTLTIQAGSHTITKEDTANLYYLSLVPTANGLSSVGMARAFLVPNPAVSHVRLSPDIAVERVEFYNLSGSLVKTAEAGVERIDVSDLAQGSYLVKLRTRQGMYHQILIKR